MVARILTASILATLIVTGTLCLPTSVMLGLFVLVALPGSWEWGALAGLRGTGRALYAVSVIAVFLLVHEAGGPAWLRPAVIAAGVAWWLIAALWVVAYQLRRGPTIRNRALLAGAGWLAFVPALCALADLLARGADKLLLLFALVWVADVLAFAGGRAWGRRRLADRVSPGKTWAGIYCGCGGALLLVALANSVLELLPFTALVPIAAAALTAAVFGDLLESLLKRLRGVKDSGSLLPGHGGVLDRVDSLLAAAPVFSVALNSMSVTAWWRT